jgi:DNA invertase Pin-like site-specific DNA recombinase
MRKGREFYSKNYEKAISLYNQGKEIKDIAKELNISYSAAYHWIKKLRKPDAGRMREFEEFLKKNGPTAVIDLKDKFVKHNEIFLTATKRKIQIKRLVLTKNLGDYSTWYYLPEQQELLKEKIDELKEKIKKMQLRFSDG